MPTASTIFDAMLAIARAARAIPPARRHATFSYNAAIQQYNAGDLSRARASALQAISQTAQQPIGAPTPAAMAPIVLPAPPAFPMPAVTSVAQVDAEEFLALARRALIACTCRTHEQFDGNASLYVRAVRENVAQRYLDVRRDSAAVIAACAPAQRTLNQQQATPAP